MYYVHQCCTIARFHLTATPALTQEKIAVWVGWMCSPNQDSVEREVRRSLLYKILPHKLLIKAKLISILNGLRIVLGISKCSAYKTPYLGDLDHGQCAFPTISSPTHHSPCFQKYFHEVQILRVFPSWYDYYWVFFHYQKKKKRHKFSLLWPAAVVQGFFSLFISPVLPFNSDIGLQCSISFCLHSCLPIWPSFILNLPIKIFIIF